MIKGGINFATGVPCGVQKYIIEFLSSSSEILHIPSIRESEAIGIAVGAYLAGKKPLIYMQNSGLFECLNDISSLMLCYKIPVILSVSWRGAPGEDAPQHLVNGEATSAILNIMGIPHFFINRDNLSLVVKDALSEMERNQKPSCILIRRGSFLI